MFSRMLWGIHAHVLIHDSCMHIMAIKILSVIYDIPNVTVHKYDFCLSPAEGSLFPHLLNGNKNIWKMTVTGGCK